MGTRERARLFLNVAVERKLRSSFHLIYLFFFCLCVAAFEEAQRGWEEIFVRRGTVNRASPVAGFSFPNHK